jgi:hypothetical protein
MCVIAFSRVRDPGVMIEGFSGGAHCCQVPVIYIFNSAQSRYVKVTDLSPDHPKNTYVIDDNEGLIPKVAGNRVVLTTGDDRFSYAFGCYACSETPLVLYAVGPDGLIDVTSQHPALIESHARFLWQRALAAVRAENVASGTSPAPFGFLAPWVADECDIGRGRSAFPKLEQLGREGKLSTAMYHKSTLNHGSFLLDLRSFLLSDGYCTGQI